MAPVFLFFSTTTETGPERYHTKHSKGPRKPSYRVPERVQGYSLWVPRERASEAQIDQEHALAHAQL